MSTIRITVNISQLDKEDRRAIQYAAAAGSGNRSSNDPESPKPPVDLSDMQAMKEFYETQMSEFVRSIHKSYIEQSSQVVESEATFKQLKSDWLEATPEQREAARVALRS